MEVLNPTTNVWKEKGAETTMFPDDWSIDKTKWEINGAWNISDFEIIDPIKNIWQGTSPNGIKIKGFINNRTLAYPLYKGDELK